MTVQSVVQDSLVYGLYPQGPYTFQEMQWASQANLTIQDNSVFTPDISGNI